MDERQNDAIHASFTKATALRFYDAVYLLIVAIVAGLAAWHYYVSPLNITLIRWLFLLMVLGYYPYLYHSGKTGKPLYPFRGWRKYYPKLFWFGWTVHFILATTVVIVLTLYLLGFIHPSP